MGNPIHMTKRGYGVASIKGGRRPTNGEDSGMAAPQPCSLASPKEARPQTREGDFLFDEIDLPLIRAHTWHLGKRGYPATHVAGKTVVLHRLLFPDAEGYEVDHINGDKLDKRRSNLRLCTHQQNAYNQKRRRTNTSGYIGVSYVRGQGCYEAYIHHHGRKHHLGLFPDAAMAARTRDCVAKLLFKEYARLNFPGGRKHGPR